MAVEAPFEAAQHGVGVAARHRRGGDRGRVGADEDARGVGRHALAAGAGVERLDVVAVARVVVRVDDLEVLAAAQGQAVALKPRGDDVRPADEDGNREAFLQHRGGGAQHALVLAVGEDDALGRAAGAAEHRAHDEAGVEDEAVEPVVVGVEITDRAARHAAVHGGARHRRRNAQDEPRVEGRRDQVFRPEELGFAAKRALGEFGRRLVGEFGDRLNGGELHLLVDRGRAHVERAAEHVGEAQDIVDLVGVVRAPGADHRVGAHGARRFGIDLGLRVGERQDQRLVAHPRHHLRLEHAAGRQPEEHVRPVDHFGQLARLRSLGIDRLPAVHGDVPAFIDHAVDVGDPDVLALHPDGHQQVEAGERGGARTGGDELYLARLAARQFERVHDRGGDDDSGAVLVVVEHRNVHALLQPRLDLETLRRLDVFQVDAAEGRLKRRHHVAEALHVELVDLEVEDIDAGELLEQDRLALHHRLRRLGPDVAQPQHRGAVGDHAYEIAAHRELVDLFRVRHDGLAGGRHARRIGQRQVALVRQRLDRLDLELSGARFAVIDERVALEFVRGTGHSLIPPKPPVRQPPPMNARLASSMRRRASLPDCRHLDRPPRTQPRARL